MKKKEIEERIVELIHAGWKKLGMPVDKKKIRKMVRLFNTNGDGMKRVVVSGITYIVPIEDIFLKGLKTREIHKYPTERQYNKMNEKERTTYTFKDKRQI